MAKIKIQDLEQIFIEIIKKLRYEEIKIVNFSHDLYRYIPTDNWNNFEADVVEVGSLEDDIDALLTMIYSNEEIPCTYVDLDRVAAILRAISQEENPV